MKILICDDDISTVSVLEHQIDWEKKGIDKVLTAYNGKAAIEIVKEERPELVICDIGMPQVSGIEVLKYIHQNGILCAFSFLTSYESFSYAQEAIRYGAVNYLTKPFELDDVEEAVGSMIDYVLAEMEKSQATRIIATETNHLLRALRDGYYGADKAMIDDALRRHQVPLNADSRFVIVSVIADTTKVKDKDWDQSLLRHSLRNMAQEVIADQRDFSTMVIDPDETYDILQIFVPEDRFSEVSLVRRCSSFVQLCIQNLSIQPVCLIGEGISLHQAAEVGLMLKNRIESLRMQTGKVFTLSELDKKRDEVHDVLDQETVHSFIRTRDKSGYMSLIGEKAQRAAAGIQKGDSGIQQLHHDLMQAFYSCLSDNHIQAHSLFEKSVMRELNRHAERSVFDFVKFASYLYDASLEALQQIDASSDIISTVKQYMKDHFREDIDRGDIAAVAFITPNYLSKRFRAETGMSLREYINKLRIDDSKRMLLTTSLPISTIAMEVGFGNISYFSTVFRKHTGISPIEWRENPALREEAAGRQTEAEKAGDEDE